MILYRVYLFWAVKVDGWCRKCRYLHWRLGFISKALLKIWETTIDKVNKSYSASRHGLFAVS